MNLINQGRTAEIYDLGDGKVLKLFQKTVEATAIEEEMTMAQLIQAFSLPAPKFYGKMEYQGRTGLIYEYINGPSMMTCMPKSSPWALAALGKQMADAHAMVHQFKVEQSPGPNFDQKYRLEWQINRSNHLTDEMKQRIIGYLNQLPEGHSLCHGDMNPANIILGEQGPVIIDWMGGVLGNPAGDVARVVVMHKCVALTLPFLIKVIVRILLLPLFRSAYVKRYIQITGISPKELKQWELPIAAAALYDGAPPEETRRLLKFIRRELKKVR